MIEPTELNVYLTNRCNAACVVCARGNGSGVPEEAPDVTPALVRDALRAWPTIHGVTIAGFGEPLLAAGLVNVVHAASEGGRAVGLITNGILLQEHLDFVADLPLTSLSVSLNATTQREREAFGMPGDFGILLRSITDLARHAPYDVRVSFIVHRGNVHRCDEFLDMACGLGVQGVDLLNLLPPYGLQAGNARAFWQAVITETSLSELDQIQELLEHEHAGLVGAWPVPLSLDRTLCQCQSTYRVVGIDGNGSVTVCRRVIPPRRNLGSMWGMNPLDSKPHMKHRSALEAGDWRALPDACRMCWGRGVRG